MGHVTMRPTSGNPSRGGLQRDAGFALPTVMLAIVAAFALGTATIVASVGAQSGTTRDQNTKAALAAAEAGVSNALLRYNRVRTTSLADACVPVGGAAPDTSGWCAASGTGTVDRGTYQYWVRPNLTELQVVSLGTVDGVSRRIEIEAHSAQSPPSGLKPFAQHSVIGLDYVTQASNSSLAGNVATNGDITIDANASLVCEPGGAQVGAGHTVTGTYSCPPYQEGEVVLPPVNQGDVATNNSNGRITMAKSGVSGGDTISGNSNKLDWDPVTRTLTLNQNVSLTLGGANYSLCKLVTSSNSNLFVAGGQQVRIYFDSPEACGLTGPVDQLSLASNSSIQATGTQPLDLALLFVGSDSISTGVRLASNTLAPGPCGQTFVVYAPRSDITLASNSYICGAVAGKSITAEQNARVTTSTAGSEFELPNTESQYFIGYAPSNFIECTATVPPASAPDQGC